MVKDQNFRIYLKATVDNREETKPWYDACLVAHKAGEASSENTQELESRVNNLESKLDLILEKLNK